MHGESAVSRKPIPRAFAILTAIGESGGSDTLSGISNSTRLPKSTVHRLLAEMQNCGLVERAGHHYSHGSALARVGKVEAGVGVQRLRRGVLPYLIDVQRRTGYFVGIGVARGSRVHFVQTIYDYDHCPLVEQIENDSQLTISAAGKVLMAYDPGLVARLSIRDGHLECAGPEADLEAWMGLELEGIRRRQIYFNLDGPGLLAAAAVPVFDVAGVMVAALSFGALRKRFDSREAHSSLLAARIVAHRILRSDL
ncbi:helix-turn-helix domain-containing protein [Amycolatopsis sp. WAC 04182]|uniref:helix-turn-helix domain-containing protein n=1 Tax=Amycolatopsis sp. WAC 04182 TaxID=2203198 RepID=UPI0013159E0E|nr:helix-turn-helix domain-containing protein [Amycolatopsis sp. WAC 04182]